MSRRVRWRYRALKLWSCLFLVLFLKPGVSEAQQSEFSPLLTQALPAKENPSTDLSFALNTKPFISKKDYALGGALSLLFTAVPIGLGMALAANRESDTKVAGLGLALTGLTLGPSAIQAYNGYGGHALAATGLRFVGEAIAIVAMAVNAPHLDCDVWDGQEGHDCEDGNPWPGLLAGGLIYAGGVAYSFIQPALHIRPKHTSTDLPLHLLPRLAISPQGHAQYGLGMQFPF